MCRVLIFFMSLFCLSFSNLENVHKKHEYLFTFKGPTITPPNSNDIPFFDIGGHVIAGKDRIRLTTSLPNQQGWIWSKNASSFEGFQIDIVFKISGNGRVGADGLALWVVQSKSYGGPAIGASASWQGLGILFDTYDSHGHGRNPSVVGIVNDGSKIYTPESGGKEISVGHCVREFRNMPFSTQCRVTYFNKVLVLTMSPGLSKDHDGMEECFRANVDLPRADYYFGLTSSTGELADDHDVEKMEVHSLTEKKAMEADMEKMISDEKKRYEEEYQQKVDNIAKTDVHENKSTDDFGDVALRQNLMALWQEIAGQHNTLRYLVTSVDYIKVRESGGEMAAIGPQFDLLRKDLFELKNNVELVSRKLENSGNTFQNQQAFMQVHNSMDSLKSDVLKLFDKVSFVQQSLEHTKDNSNIKEAGDNCATCVSLPIMIIIGSLQSAFIIGFLMYQKSRDNAAKKFY